MKEKFFLLSLLVMILLQGCSTQQSLPPVPLTPSPQTPSVSSEIKIGVLLPLQGEHQELGELLQKAAELIYFKELKNQNIHLIFEDTSNSQEKAVNAVKNLIAQKVHVIIGPIFTDQTKAIQSALKGKDIPVFSLSNDYTSAAGSVFVMGINPLDSMREGLTHAAKLGVKRLVALLPQSVYGQQLRQELPKLASQLNITVKDICMYSPQNPYNCQNLSFENIDALFLPEGNPNGSKILAALFHQGTDISYIRVIGSSLWETMTSPPEGGLFATTDMERENIFFKEFETVYGKRPPKISVILYDALLLGASLKDMATHQLLKEKALQSQAFMGLEGTFRFNAGQYAQRSMSVYEIVQGRPQKIKFVQ